MTRRPQAGVTLIEMLIAVTLLSVLSVGILMAMNVALGALHKGNGKLMDNRRVAGAQRVLEQQIAGFVPAKMVCSGSPSGPGAQAAFFDGQPQTMRFVSTYSLQEAWRGIPRILELQVIPGDQGIGVRLIVNEIPYAGPMSAGLSCTGMTQNPEIGQMVPQFLPVQAGPQSFVLADKLAACQFSYLEPAKPPVVQRWLPEWVLARWPLGIRVDMAPLVDNPARLRPLTITAAVRTTRAPDITYVDY